MGTRECVWTLSHYKIKALTVGVDQGLYRFHFSARRAPASGIGDFFSETKAAYFIVHLRDA
eukprot:6450115-Prymnesium_polylepis.1